MEGDDVMEKKRPEDIENAENNSHADEITDVSDMNLFQRLGRGISNLSVRAGLCTVKFIAAVLLGVIKGAAIILSELMEFIYLIFRVIRWIFRELTDNLRQRNQINRELQLAVRKAKKEGRAAYTNSILRFAGSYLFGENGIFYTAFNYILPIVSLAFLIGVIRYGSGLEYGISVEYNGREIGVISAEADFKEAEREVQQRISYSDNDQAVDLSASFSLRIISDSDIVMNSAQLANEMLAASDEELTEAYGIYIDGKFVGAVKDKAPVQDALDEKLLNYSVDGIVKDISYKNKIEYTQGIYLADSVMEEQKTIDMLTSSTSKTAVYFAQADDSIVTICQKYNMTLEDFERLNPSVDDKLKVGQMVSVTRTESYLPIQYVREIELSSLLDYETVQFETSSLNVGTTAVLVKGKKGEKNTTVEVTYVDGIEYSRKTISSEIIREPVVEQIGIGTYSARPASSSTMLYGSGQFGWPIDGGYISDTFISDRNHQGLDIAAPAGTDIYASGDGVVVSAGWNPGGYGYFVMIDHLNGYQTVYAHMSAVYATEGQTVARGQLIGAVGNTGNSNGDHCHLEVRYMGVCYDPAQFINTIEPDKKPEDDE